MFPNRWIGRAGPIPRPPRVPYLILCDYVSWEYLKHFLLRETPTTIEDLETRLCKAFKPFRKIHWAMFTKTRKVVYASRWERETVISTIVLIENNLLLTLWKCTIEQPEWMKTIKYYGLQPSVTFSSTCYTSEFFFKLSKLLVARMVTITDYHPQADRHVERFNPIMVWRLVHYAAEYQKK